MLGAFALNGWVGHPLLMAAFSCDTALLDGVFGVVRGVIRMARRVILVWQMVATRRTIRRTSIRVLRACTQPFQSRLL
jgi:hypothetical protein